MVRAAALKAEGAYLLTVRRGLEPLDRIAHQVEQRSVETRALMAARP